jgi:hypothetical protein
VNIRNLFNRIVSSMLAIGIVGSLVGLGAHSISAQSITATMPFPFCVNNHAYPGGKYRFTRMSPDIVLMRDVNGKAESLFQVSPEDAAQGLSSDSEESVDGVTFHTFHGVRELRAVHGPGSNVTFELMGQAIARDKVKTRGSVNPTNCFPEESSIRGRSTTGR